MKLRRIEHERCNEYDGDTLVWIPDVMTDQDFYQAIHTAKSEYLSNLKNFDEGDRPNPIYSPHGGPQYKHWPDKTVREINDIWANLKQEYDAWKERQTQGKKTFQDYLYDHGVEPYWKHSDSIEGVDLDWGHNHGLRLQYDVTKHEAEQDYLGAIGMRKEDDW